MATESQMDNKITIKIEPLSALPITIEGKSDEKREPCNKITDMTKAIITLESFMCNFKQNVVNIDVDGIIFRSAPLGNKFDYNIMLVEKFINNEIDKSLFSIVYDNVTDDTFHRKAKLVVETCERGVSLKIYYEIFEVDITKSILKSAEYSDDEQVIKFYRNHNNYIIDTTDGNYIAVRKLIDEFMTDVNESTVCGIRYDVPKYPSQYCFGIKYNSLIAEHDKHNILYFPIKIMVKDPYTTFTPKFISPLYFHNLDLMFNNFT